MTAFFFYCVKEGGARGIRGAPATVSFIAKTNAPDSLVMAVQPGPTGTPHRVEAQQKFHCNLSILTRRLVEDGDYERAIKLTAFDHLAKRPTKTMATVVSDDGRNIWCVFGYPTS